MIAFAAAHARRHRAPDRPDLGIDPNLKLASA